MKPTKVKILLKLAGKAPCNLSELEIEGTITRNELSDHDTAGILFASEFAINSHADMGNSKSIRAHIFVE